VQQVIAGAAAVRQHFRDGAMRDPWPCTKTPPNPRDRFRFKRKHYNPESARLLEDYSASAPATIDSDTYVPSNGVEPSSRFVTPSNAHWEPLDIGSRVGSMTSNNHVEPILPGNMRTP